MTYPFFRSSSALRAQRWLARQFSTRVATVVGVDSIGEQSHTGTASAGSCFRAAYAQLHNTGFRKDPAQAAAVTALARVGDDLSQAQQAKQSRGAFERLLSAVGMGTPAVRGLYLHGGVGCGKTLLAQTLYDCVPESVGKHQAHFHVFVLNVHTRLHAKRGLVKDKVADVARDIAEDSRFLFLDEVQVTDISDALLAKALLEQLFARGVCVLATSNRAPERLYERGLQRELFTPLITRIREHCDVHEMGTTRDYRLRDSRSGRIVYFVDNEGGFSALNAVFDDLAAGFPAREMRLDVDGRNLVVPLAVADKDVAFFTFDELCNRPLASADYVALCNRFHTIFLANVPTLDVIASRNESRRLRSFVDQAYRCKVKLIINAAAPVHELFVRPLGVDVETEEAFESHRIESRLTEMQTDAYLEAPWLPDNRAVREAR